MSISELKLDIAVVNHCRQRAAEIELCRLYFSSRNLVRTSPNEKRHFHTEDDLRHLIECL
jgi:hypothetical protein